MCSIKMRIINPIVVTVLCILSSTKGDDGLEMCPVSKEKQLIEQMVRTEIKVESMLQETRKTEEHVLSVLEYRMKDLQKSLDALKETQDAQADQLRDVTENNADLERRVSVVEDTVAPVAVVAFVARHLKNVAIDNGETLVFSTIVFNSGAGYDNSTGIFTVPVSGLYQFNVRLCIFVNTFAHIEIVSEDVIITRTRMVDEGTQFHSCIELSGFAVLSVGKRVWVTSSRSSDVTENVWHNPGIVWNTFSGVLINRDN